MPRSRHHGQPGQRPRLVGLLPRRSCRLPLLIASLAAAASVLPAQAGSLATSSAVGGSSASSATSASSEASSDSSSRRQKTAAGAYRIIDAAAVADQPGQVRLRLLALTDASPEPEHVLVLPQATAAAQGLAPGQTVTALARPYGTEFRRAADAPAFFLVLADGFERELDARPLPL